MKLTYDLLRKQRTHNLRYIIRTLLIKFLGVFKRNSSIIFLACPSHLSCNGWTLMSMAFIDLFVLNVQCTCSLTCKRRWLVYEKQCFMKTKVMNTQLLLCIKGNKQLVKFWKYFTDFNFCGLQLTAKYCGNWTTWKFPILRDMPLCGMVVHVINVYFLINLFNNLFYDNSYIKIQTWSGGGGA